MPELRDFEELVKRREQKQAERARHVFEQRAPQFLEIAHKAQTVVDHPGWQQFLNAIETRIRAVEARRTTTMNTMVFGKAMGHELELLKIELNTMDAEINALRYAQGLVPQMIEYGKQVATGVQ